MNLSLASIFNRNTSKALIAIAVAVILIVWWSRTNDPHVNRAEQYINSDSELRESIGVVEELDLVKSTTFFRESGIGAAKEAGRKRYQFIVYGKNGKADVTVIVQISKNNEVGSIEIENVDL